MSRRRERRAKSKRRRARILEGVQLMEPNTEPIPREVGERQKRFYQSIFERGGK